MFRKLLVVIGLIGFTAVLQSDDKDKPPPRIEGKVVEVDKEKGKVTFTIKVKDADNKKTLAVEDFVLIDAKGKKHEGKAILTVLRAGDPIIIPKVGKDSDKIVVMLKKKD